MTRRSVVLSEMPGYRVLVVRRYGRAGREAKRATSGWRPKAGT